jgi:lipopolysaccharide export system protein LptC
MARADNLHSRLVGILKLALPLIALALLSTLFLFSRKINPEDAIPYATVDVADRLQDPKMTDAGFAGMTADGASLAVTAVQAKPTAQGAALQTVQGKLTMPDGAETDLAATTVILDSAARQLELSDGAELRTSGGYVVNSAGLGIATDRTYVQSRGEITAVGPLGTLSANAMTLSQAEPDGPYLLVFKGKVRLLYQPVK